MRKRALQVCCNALLLTKRPGNWLRRMGDACACAALRGEDVGRLFAWRDGTPPPNVWIGTTVENQEMADKRIPELLKIPAKMRFLSCEPLLEEVTLDRIGEKCRWEHMTRIAIKAEWPSLYDMKGIHWVICGGESGARARPMDVEWARSLSSQCENAGVPFFMKQMDINGKVTRDMNLFPSDLKTREFPQCLTN